MVAVLDFSAGFSVDRIIRFALGKINGFTLSSKAESSYNIETAKEIFNVSNGTLAEEHDWVFLKIIARTRGYDSGSYYNSVALQKHPISCNINAISTLGYQKLPDEPIRVSPEELVGLFPYYYIDVLSCKIAANLCVPLKSAYDAKRVMENDFAKSLSAAIITDNKLAFRYGYFCE